MRQIHSSKQITPQLTLQLAQPKLLAVLIASAFLSLSACSSGVNDIKADNAAGFGANPALNAPNKKLLPTINIAPAIGWPDKTKPVAAADFSVAAFAQGLDHPRWLYVLPNGDVLVAETNAPPK